MGLQNAKVIDIHAHAVLAETMGAAGAYGPELGDQDTDSPWFRVGDYRLDGVRYVGTPFMDVRARLERMDQAGVDFQVLSPNPLTYFHYIDAREAIVFCRRNNDVLSELAKAHSERLAAAAALPMQDVSAACDELDRAVNELGMLGGYIGTDLTVPLDDPSLDPFYEKVVALNVPLFIHPAPAGIDGPKGDPKLERFDLDLLCGFAAQETLAVATLIYGGVLHRHPKLDICISHAAGAVPFLIGRMAAATVKRKWSPDFLQADGAFEETLRRFWFDTHVHDDRAFDYLVDIVGTDHLVFGTNFAGWDQGEVKHRSGDFDLAANARRLLRAESS